MIVTDIVKRFNSKIALNFVPKHLPVNRNDIELFKEFMNNTQNVAVITGAGISTESGMSCVKSTFI